MAKALIVYCSKSGQTQKIANFIAGELEAQGHRTALFDVNECPEGIQPKTFDLVVVGVPVYLHSFPRKLKRWITKHAVDLRDTHSAFFSVYLGVLQKRMPTESAGILSGDSMLS